MVSHVLHSIAGFPYRRDLNGRLFSDRMVPMSAPSTATPCGTPMGTTSGSCCLGFQIAWERSVIGSVPQLGLPTAEPMRTTVGAPTGLV